MTVIEKKLQSVLAWSTKFDYIRDNFRRSVDDKPVLALALAGFFVAAILAIPSTTEGIVMSAYEIELIVTRLFDLPWWQLIGVVVLAVTIIYLIILWIFLPFTVHEIRRQLFIANEYQSEQIELLKQLAGVESNNEDSDR